MQVGVPWFSRFSRTPSRSPGSYWFRPFRAPVAGISWLRDRVLLAGSLLAFAAALGVGVVAGDAPMWLRGLLAALGVLLAALALTEGVMRSGFGLEALIREHTALATVVEHRLPAAGRTLGARRARRGAITVPERLPGRVRHRHRASLVRSGLSSGGADPSPAAVLRLYGRSARRPRRDPRAREAACHRIVSINRMSVGV